MPKFCLLPSYSPSFFDELCKIWRGFIRYLQKFNNKMSMKLSSSKLQLNLFFHVAHIFPFLLQFSAEAAKIELILSHLASVMYK